MKYILSLDIGTTSAKTLVVSQHGEVLASAREFYPTQHPEPDLAEQNPDEIFRAVKKIIRLAADKVNGKIDGVCFSSAMHSLMAVNASGEALTPLITWADLRSKNEAREMEVPDKEEIYMETGTPIHPMSPFCKLLWLKKNRPELLKGTTKFIGIKEYIWHKLFREFVVDHSIASATGLLNIVNKSWSDKALKLAGITSQQLSTPRSVYSIFRIADERVSKELGLQANVPWVLGASDGCLANLGSGAMDDDTLSLTIGTSGAVRKVVKKISPDVQGRTFHYLFDEEILITGGATNNGAILAQWFSENILKEKVDLVSFGDRAAAIPVGADGLIFLPYLLGERAPVFDPDASGVFFGVRQEHTREHFMRAVLEGVGYALFSIAEIVQKNSGGFKKVAASGGFIKSSPWVQMISDIFGKEVHVRGTEDASALGAAVMGFKALEIESHFQFSTERIFHPDPVRHEKYSRYFSIYKNLYPHLLTNFQLLNKIYKD